MFGPSKFVMFVNSGTGMGEMSGHGRHAQASTLATNWWWPFHIATFMMKHVPKKKSNGTRVEQSAISGGGDAGDGGGGGAQ